MAAKTPLWELRDLEVQHLPLERLTRNPRNVRKHPAKQIAKLARNIKLFGCTSPLVVDELLIILAGHGRFEALKRLDMITAPCVVLKGLTPEQKIAFAIADNKLGDESSFDD